MFKSDIYVLGLLLIECGCLADLSKEVEPDLDKYFEEFSARYSEDMYRILENMLQIQPEDRPTFNELKEYLVREMELNVTLINEPVLSMLPDQPDV